MDLKVTVSSIRSKFKDLDNRPGFSKDVRSNILHITCLGFHFLSMDRMILDRTQAR